MQLFCSTAAAAMMFGAVIAGAATVEAAPLVPLSGLDHGSHIETARYRQHRMRHRHHSTRAQRRMRRMNTLRHGNPNARNPSRPGYQQQLGNTTGGPRY